MFSLAEDSPVPFVLSRIALLGRLTLLVTVAPEWLLMGSVLMVLHSHFDASCRELTIHPAGEIKSVSQSELVGQMKQVSHHAFWTRPPHLHFLLFFFKYD